MRRVVIFVYFTFISVIEACDNDRQNLPAVKLKNDILCDYDGMLRPVTDHRNNVTVNIRMMLKYFEYDHDTNTLAVDSWLIMQWKDQHLKWKPSDYSGIKSIHLTSDDIWMPDLSIFNTRDHSQRADVLDYVRCLVNNFGIVICVPAVRSEALCVADLSEYPYDTQNCTMRMGSWVHTGEELNIVIANKSTISTDDLTSNGIWELVSSQAVKIVAKHKCCPNSTYPSVHFSFVIRRLNGGHTASIIIPAIVIIIITLTSLWLSPLISERMTLCVVNLICTFMYSQYVSWMVPLRGENTPYIILFARDSLLLCAFTILFTVILKNLVTRKTLAPAWISTLVACILGCRPGQWLFLDDNSLKGVATAKREDDADQIIDSQGPGTANSSGSPPTEDYIVFAKMLDRTLFIIYCVIFFGMFLTYTP